MERLEVEDPPSEINRDLLLRLLPKLNYPVILQAVEQLSPYMTQQQQQTLPKLPPELPLTLVATSTKSSSCNNATTEGVDERINGNDQDQKGMVTTLPAMEVNNTMDDENMLIANLYKILFDIHLIEGTLICPGTGRKFPVKDAIPNMLLHADEI